MRDHTALPASILPRCRAGRTPSQRSSTGLFPRSRRPEHPEHRPSIAYGDRWWSRDHTYGSHIGTIAVGKAADLVLIDWDKLAYPNLDPETSVLDAVLQRAKSDGVDLVMVAGEVIYEGGRFTRVDRAAALKELQESLRHSLADDEIERRQLSKALLPYVRCFYGRQFRS
jgi:Amidohydrolase family